MSGDRTQPLGEKLRGALRADPHEERAALAAVQAKLFKGAPPTRAGRYELGEVLGHGGCGLVVRGFDPQLERDVAVKMLRSTAKPVDARRLAREAKAAAHVVHPNVVEVYDAGTTEGGEVYVVMELVEGEDLRRWLAAAPRSQSDILGAFEAAGRGLAAAHTQGLVHRDFKPANVLIGPGVVKVADFGLAKIVGELDDEATDPGSGQNRSDPGPTRLTRTGLVLGTPAYMAPEQIRGDTPGPATDQFSFCVALFEALCGQRPFESPTMEGRLRAQAAGRLPEGANRLSGPLCRALVRGLAFEPSDRFPSMDALLVALRARWGRLRMVTLGFGATFGVVTVTLAGLSSIAPDCSDAGAEMQDHWNVAVASSIRDAIRSTAEDPERFDEQWPRASAKVDAFANAWVQQRRETCEAARSIVNADERSRCMAARIDELHGLLEVWSEPDARIAAGTARLAATLTPPGVCADLGLLPSAHGADHGRAQRAELAEALAWHNAGRFDEAERIAKTVLERAEAADDAALRAAALNRLGRVDASRRKLDDAQTKLSEAYFAATELEDDQVAFEAAIGMVSVVLRRHDLDQGTTWLRHAQAILDRSGGTVLEQSRVLFHRGIIADRSGDLGQARTHYAAALEVARRSPPGNEIDVAQLEVASGRADRFSDPQRAVESFERGLSLIEDSLGPRAPDVIPALILAGRSYRRIGDLDAAGSRLERAREVLESSHIGDPTMSAAVLVPLGHVHADREDWAEAERIFARTLTIVPDQPPLPLQRAHALAGAARVAEATGDCTKAMAAARSAAEVYERLTNPEHHDLVLPLTVLGKCATADGDSNSARTLLQRAVAIDRRGPRDPARGSAARTALTALGEPAAPGRDDDQ